MIYTVKCKTCGKKGQRGVYSKQLQPDGWIVIAWGSKHSEHIETVCSVKCLHRMPFHDEDLPRGGS